MNIVHSLLLCLVWACLSAVTHAQVQFPKASAASLAYGRYADIPISHYTGTANVQVPVHTVTEGPLSLPIALQYHTGGLQVNAPAGDVGLGWLLNTGGMISRTIRGIADDQYPNGYLNKGSQVTTTSGTDWNYDTEPDIFTYSVAGYTGKFFIAADKKVKMVPKSDVRIEYSKHFYNSPISKFTLTTPDGTIYEFGGAPDIDGIIRPARDYTTDNPPFKDEDVTGWHLMRISTPDQNHVIHIEYTIQSYSYYVQKPCPEIYKYKEGNSLKTFKPGCKNGGLYVTTWVQSVVPKRIITTYETLEFTHSARSDLSSYSEPALRVTGATINNGGFCSKVDFNQSYFYSDGNDGGSSVISHLKLDNVQRKSCSGSVTEPAWVFNYEGRIIDGGKSFAPSKANHDLDHWGYYNFSSATGHNDPNTDLTPPVAVQLGGSWYTVGSANREPLELAMKQGMLRRVTYPTGGYLELDYEANKYSKAGSEGTPVDLSSCYSTQYCDYTQTSETSFTYSSTVANGINPSWELCVEANGNNSSQSGWGRVEVFPSGSSSAIASMEFTGNPYYSSCLNGGLPTVGYASSNQPMQVGQTYRIKVTSYYAKATFTINYQAQPSEAVAGGLRIKKTTVFDGLNSSRNIVKNYTYGDAGNETISSGILFRQPKYTFSVNAYTAVINSHSNAPLSDFDGVHVGYKRVVVSHNGIGKEEYIYHLEEDYVNHSDYPRKPAPYKRKSGQLKSSKIFSEGGNIVGSTAIVDHSDGYETYGYSAATGYIFAKRELFIYQPGSSQTSKRLYTTYQLSTSVYRPATVTKVMDGVTIQQSFEYGNNILSPIAAEAITSEDDVIRTETEYLVSSPDFWIRDRARIHNMIGIPFRVITMRNGTPIDGSETEFRFYKADGTSPSTEKSGRVEVPRIYRNKRFERSYDENGTIDAVGVWEPQSTITEYNLKGLPEKFNDNYWSTTTIGYDAKGKLPTTRSFAGQTESVSYFPNSSILQSRTGSDGTSTLHTYDDLGRLKTVRDECLDIETSYSYGFKWAGQNVNWVETIVDYPQPDSRSQVDQLISREYLDGLGRQIETVQRSMGVTANEDVITATDYDKYGRVKYGYDPRSWTDNYGNYRSAQGSWEKSTISYEDNPLGRQSSLTSTAWPHPASTTYGSNTGGDAVKVDGSSVTYAAGELSKVTQTDGNGNGTVTFTNKSGQQVLSRQTDGGGGKIDTYSLYDGKGRVRHVIPYSSSLDKPRGIYSYVYDGADRLLEKSVPSKEPLFYRYNQRGLLGAVQDAELRAEGKWYVYQYDNRGRTEQEGFYAGSVSGSFSNLVPSEPLVTNLYGSQGIETGRVKQVRTRILGTNDWLQTDNYYTSCGLLDYQTGNNHLRLPLTAPEVTSYEYDGATNVTESTYNHKNGASVIPIVAEHNYNFAGRAIRNFIKIGQGVKTQLNHLDYDHLGNIVVRYQGKTTQSGTRAWLQKIDYSYRSNGMMEGINLNSTGKLSGAQLALPSNGGSYVNPNPGQPGTTSYDDKDLFQLQLYRDVVATGTSAPARFNGDITSVATQVRGRRQQLWNLSYDGYDRMTNASFYQRERHGVSPSAYSSYSETPSYYTYGDINRLTRYGLEKSTQGTYTKRQYDNMVYHYIPETRQVKKITESFPGSNSLGYTPLPGEYQYDLNGNMTFDPSKQIAVSYNHLDLPEEISWADGRKLLMTYDAGGTLLTRQEVANGGSVLKRTDYIGGIEYVDNDLEMVYHQEGRVDLRGTGQQFDYVLDDHLGNTRLMYSDLNNNGIPEVPNEIIQEEHYYPFGMKMTGPWMSAGSSSATMPYQYNGIDHVNAFNLNVNMAAFRTLDPVIGRWWQVDPKAEHDVANTPYGSMYNNPINYADPLGDEPITLTIALIAGVTGAGFNIWQNRKEIFTDGGVNWGKFAYAGAVGAGAALLGVAAAPAAAVGGTAWATAGAFAWAGAVGGGVGGATQGFANAFVFRTSDNLGQDIISGTFKGGVGGFIAGGVLGGLTGFASHWISHAAGGGNAVGTKPGTAPDDPNFAVTLDNPVTVTAKASNEIVNAPRKVWQQKFKHAVDFGVEGKWNPGQVKAFRSAINQHINANGTQVINGAYRNASNAVRFHINPNNGLTVVSSLKGRFITGYRADASQIASILNRGFLW